MATATANIFGIPSDATLIIETVAGDRLRLISYRYRSAYSGKMVFAARLMRCSDTNGKWCIVGRRGLSASGQATRAAAIQRVKDIAAKEVDAARTILARAEASRDTLASL